jgi:hypothetical protein
MSDSGDQLGALLAPVRSALPFGLLAAVWQVLPRLP